MVVDGKPFTEVEARFADTKFYLMAWNAKDVNHLPPSVIKAQTPKILNLTIHSTLNKEKQVDSQRIQSTSTSSSNDKPVVVRYVSKSNRKDKQPLSPKHKALKSLAFPVAKLDAIKRS